MPPRFSIVLPTHNRADVLPFAVRSALWQTVGDFELLIVGDGCTDGTAEAIAAFSDDRIHWLDLPKAPGFGYRNRNVALEQASGEYIAYLAHDDIWLPDHLERLVSLLETRGAEFAYSRGLAVTRDGWMLPDCYNLEIPAHQATLWRAESAATMSSVVHRRSCLARYGRWDEDLLRCADTELWHRMLAGAGFRNLAFQSEVAVVRFVGRWRATAAQQVRARLARRLLGGFIDEVLPPALKLRVNDGESQQQAVWRLIAEDPAPRVAEIRRAVIQYQDAVLWKAGTVARLVGLRSGLAVGAGLNGVWKAARWLCLGAERREMSSFKAKTRAREETRRRRDSR